MAKGRKTGGRTKGTPNRNTQALRERLAAKYPDYDPLLSLAAIAQDPDTELHHRIDCHKTIAAYIHPKLKALEHTVDLQHEPIDKIVIEYVSPDGTTTTREKKLTN